MTTISCVLLVGIDLCVCSAQLEVMEAERVAEGDRSSGFGVFETPAALKEKVSCYPGDASLPHYLYMCIFILL